MGLFDWIKRLRGDEVASRQHEDEKPERDAPDYPIPEGGIDALRADQGATQAFGIRPEEAERMARREDLTEQDG